MYDDLFIFKPLVSIIVPNYNHSKFLDLRFESVFNQSYQNFEVIILDDASTDGSQEILKKYSKHPKVTYCKFNLKNSGSPFKQWKKGIELAKGQFIWIAESDDCAENFFLEKCLNLIYKNPKISIVYTQSFDIDEFGKKLGSRLDYTGEFTPNIWEESFTISGFDFIKKYLSSKNVIPNASAVVFNKESINLKTIFEDLLLMKMCGDWLFWIKLSLNSSVAFISDELNYFRIHKNTSRVHNNLELRKRRLMEEREIRKYLYSIDVVNKISNKKLYFKWFELFPIKAIFYKVFYDIKLSNTSLITFFFNFIQYIILKKIMKKKYFSSIK